MNFKLDDRKHELGVSVYRLAQVTVAEVLSKPEALPGSRVAIATAAAIRGLKNGAGKLLELDVIIVDDESDPGHAEIRGPEPGKLTGSASNALKKLFELDIRLPPKN